MDVVDRLAKTTGALSFSEPVTHVYAPLDYARASVECFVKTYAKSGVEALFLGMNPGPWGMAQTGIPFGEVHHVRSFLGIEEPVARPANEHPKRPVDGFACSRSEVSGRRLWEWVAQRFERPEVFFERFFIWNWCPLAFLEASGKNRTPDKLQAHERTPLEAACDSALRDIVEVLRPARIIGVGGFAGKRARMALAETGLPIDTILHPSPASPMANRGWAAQAEVQLEAMGVVLGDPRGSLAASSV